jgi:hypothetical protein
MSREMAHKVIVPQKKIMSRSFLNRGTLVILCTRVLLFVLLCVVVCKRGGEVSWGGGGVQ